jgi:acetate kinase
MNTLVLRPGSQNLNYSLFHGKRSQPSIEGRLEHYRGTDGCREVIARIASQVSRPDVLAVRAVYGGERFRQPLIVTDESLRQIEELMPQAPLHVAVLLPLLRQCQAQLPSLPLILVFETAFFTGLPSREYLYALDAELPGMQGIRRYGFHGILHEAACRETVRRHHAERLAESPRILSICLEPRPELAAVCGLQPVMVTSGATPLEGLPGQTSCGELDPSIVIALASEHGWGAERINTVLTRESGLKGLAGEDVTFEQLYKAEGDSTRLAREIFQYRLLSACGAGVAAMGGLDAVVFSGRFVGLGQPLSTWLRPQPLFQRGLGRRRLSIRFYQPSLSRVIADNASSVLMAARLDASTGTGATTSEGVSAQDGTPWFAAGDRAPAAPSAG